MSLLDYDSMDDTNWLSDAPCITAPSAQVCKKGCCGQVNVLPTPTPTAKLVLAKSSPVTWKGRILELANDSPLHAIGTRLGGAMAGDETGTVCLMFNSCAVCPAPGTAVLVRGVFRWVVDKGAVALFVDEIQQAEAGSEIVLEQVIFCKSAPVVGIAVQVIGGEGDEFYRVLVKKKKAGEFELPWGKACDVESSQETALRIISSSFPATVKAQLTCLDGVVIDLGTRDDGCPESLVVYTARQVIIACLA